MSAVGERLRLVMGLRVATGKRATDVAHSIGCTFNLGLGRTRPERYEPRRSGAQRPGYRVRADVDFFFLAARWTQRQDGGYLLEDRSRVWRIAGELERLRERKVLSARIVGYRQGVELRLDRGAVLRVYPCWDDNDPGWNLRIRDRIFWLNGHEKIHRRR